MKILYFIPLLFLQSFANAQTTYFQQDIKYSIDVTLDDDSHILRGFERMVYTNHSKDTLKFIFIHLYPNAYKNDQTVFTEQLVQQGKTAFYFSSENDKGSIDSLDFKVNEDAVLISPYNNHDDVVLLELNQPLLPGAHISISTSFRVILPEIFSRIGHDDHNYQITQWFPKPAVYDATGWHPMHYVDQGEYYGEFGNFEVNITVPSDYIVATTGIIQDQSEKKWIDQMASRSDSMQLSNLGHKMTAQSFKTLHVKQDQVHDFAWFASKDYLIEKTEALLPNGKKVQCYAYYFPKNEKLYKGSSLIASKTISYFSEHLGTYPYEQVSIVDGKLLAGGGMEYPMITLIGALHSKSELQTAIIHEVGHNWFYGILANNERDHPWMDESLNSLYESQLDQKLQSDEAQKTLKVEKIINGSFSYLLSAKENTDQAISENSEAFTSLNYGGILYKKAPMLLAYLQSYLGETVFESCMKQYYETWKFKHPSPKDFRLIFEKESHKKFGLVF